MARLNIKKAIEKTLDLWKENSRYWLTVEGIEDINELSRDNYDRIYYGFVVGYYQGYKAAMTKQKKERE